MWRKWAKTEATTWLGDQTLVEVSFWDECGRVKARSSYISILRLEYHPIPDARLLLSPYPMQTSGEQWRPNAVSGSGISFALSSSSIDKMIWNRTAVSELFFVSLCLLCGSKYSAKQPPRHREHRGCTEKSDVSGKAA